ncbi:MAG: hypothetical protein NW214_08930 [Pseudanabaenaceae cyanobacterium bins.39]|nr:hypothetical protein [Pseudanabaenaceae cyanobacterium bins.39]
MESVITWTLGSNDPDAELNLARIGQWWTSLADQNVLWQQRSLEGTVSNAIDWSKQALDETFTLLNPSLRGITLYWYKPNSPDERNITVGYMRLDLNTQTLDVLPSSGNQYQLKITSPKVVYQKIQLNYPQFGAIKQPNGDAVILWRDEQQKLEVQIVLDASNVALLQQKLS